MFDDFVHAMQVLETCGLGFAHVLAGEYEVGYAGQGLLARPPQISFVSPTATPPSKLDVGEFWISVEPLRLSHWRKVVCHPACSSLSNLVSPAHLMVTEPEIEVAPSAGERQANPDAQPRRMAQQVELDPVLRLGEARAAGVAEALGASLPRWYEWEIATRGLRFYSCFHQTVSFVPESQGSTCPPSTIMPTMRRLHGPSDSSPARPL